MGIFSSIKKAIGLGKTKEFLLISDDECACGGNCTCGEATVEEAPKVATIKTVLPSGALKEEIPSKEVIAAADEAAVEMLENVTTRMKPTAKKATATTSKVDAKPKVKKASNRAKSAKKK